jgi:L-histidine N-alpha-methyltransferase
LTTTPTVEVLVTGADRRKAIEEDIREGLSNRPRSIPPVWFYDEVGSRLFDEITRLPEYYLTRTERSILEARAGDIAARSAADTLVEIGSGTSEKTRLLLDAMAASGQLRHIVLLDISEEILREAAAELGERYGVDVHAVVGDFRSDLIQLPRPGRRLWAFLGSTIGNFEGPARAELLGHFCQAMRDGDSLLLGTDLEKDVDRLVAAYDDSQGVTARFNLNVLSVLDRDLEADFDPARFEHRAVWNPVGRWIEMRLVSTVAQTAHIGALGMAVDLEAGEELLTEISAKFRPDRVVAELGAAGLEVVSEWTDPASDFLLTLSAVPG